MSAEHGTVVGRPKRVKTGDRPKVYLAGTSQYSGFYEAVAVFTTMNLGKEFVENRWGETQWRSWDGRRNCPIQVTEDGRFSVMELEILDDAGEPWRQPVPKRSRRL
jgi:hypothetical protein